MLIIVRKRAFQESCSMDEVQMLTDHARRESVKRYSCVQLDAKRRLIEGTQLK